MTSLEQTVSDLIFKDAGGDVLCRVSSTAPGEITLSGTTIVQPATLIGVQDENTVNTANTRGYVDSQFAQAATLSSGQTITGTKTFVAPLGLGNAASIEFFENTGGTLGVERQATDELDLVIGPTTRVRATSTAVAPMASTMSLGTAVDSWEDLYSSGSIVVSGVDVDLSGPSTGDLLTASTTTNAGWSPPPVFSDSLYAHFEKSTTQFCPANTNTTIVGYDVVVVNQGYTWSPSTGTITIPTDGVYVIIATVAFPSGAIGARISRVSINGTTQEYGRMGQVVDDTTFQVGNSSCALLALSTGDLVTITVYVGSQDLNIGGPLFYERTRLQIDRIRE